MSFELKEKSGCCYLECFQIAKYKGKGVDFFKVNVH